MIDRNALPSFTLKKAFITLQHKAQPDGLYVEDILATFGSRSHGFLILFFSLPFVQPIPLVGLSTPLGILIALVAIFQGLNRRPWLPRKVLRMHLKPNLIVSSCNLLVRILDKTERFIKPRFSFWLSLSAVRIGNALLIAMFALFLALPLPIPFSNSIPAYFLVINAIGSMEEDGILLALSYLLAVGGLIFFIALGFGALHALGSFY